MIETEAVNAGIGIYSFFSVRLRVSPVGVSSFDSI